MQYLILEFAQACWRGVSLTSLTTAFDVSAVWQLTWRYTALELRAWSCEYQSADVHGLSFRRILFGAKSAPSGEDVEVVTEFDLSLPLGASVTWIGIGCAVAVVGGGGRETLALDSLLLAFFCAISSFVFVLLSSSTIDIVLFCSMVLLISLKNKFGSVSQTYLAGCLDRMACLLYQHLAFQLEV